MNPAAFCWLLHLAILSDPSCSHPVKVRDRAEASAESYSDNYLLRNNGGGLKLEKDEEDGELPELKVDVESEFELFEGDLAISEELIDTYYSKNPVSASLLKLMGF